MYYLLDLPFLANKHFPHNCNTRRVLEMEHALRREASSLFLLKLLKPPPARKPCIDPLLLQLPAMPAVPAVPAMPATERVEHPPAIRARAHCNSSTSQCTPMDARDSTCGRGNYQASSLSSPPTSSGVALQILTAFNLQRPSITILDRETESLALDPCNNR